METEQVNNGKITQLIFLNTNHKVNIINIKTPKPKTTNILFDKSDHIICNHWYST